MHLAQITGINSPATNFPNNSYTYTNFLGLVVTRFLAFAIAASGFYFFIRLLTAGFSFLTSMGDPGKIQSAQKQLTNALIGLIVVFSAFFVAQLISAIFDIKIM